MSENVGNVGKIGYKMANPSTGLTYGHRRSVKTRRRTNLRQDGRTYRLSAKAILEGTFQGRTYPQIAERLIPVKAIPEISVRNYGKYFQRDWEKILLKEILEQYYKKRNLITFHQLSVE
jgi:hypothetical protein